MSKSPYHEAGNLLDQILTQGKSLRSVFYAPPSSGGGGAGKLRCTKATYASVCNALKHKRRIDAVLDRDGGRLRASVRFDGTRSKGLLYVLLCELLYGKYGSVRGGGKVKRNVVKFEKELRRAKEELEEEPGGGGPSTFPRYVRVNTLKITTDEAADILRRDVLGGGGGGGGGVGSSDDGGPATVYADRHVPDLLVLPPSSAARLHSHDLVRSGKVVLQDKSSCFSALALVRGLIPADGGGPEPGPEPFDCIDACAAPGNKTTHLAALLAQEMEKGTPASGGGGKKRARKCRVFAFDRSSKRIQLLRDRVSNLVPSDDESSAVEVRTAHRDFLRVDPSEAELAGVRCILLDPSCSGSGIVDAPDRLAEGARMGGNGGGDGDGAEERRRVETLANFQLVALKHAMSFPQVDRIVYSTCSVHDEENERVVATALREHNATVEVEEEGLRWETAAPDALRRWKRRGRPCGGAGDDGGGGDGGLTDAQSACLIRCDGLDGDGTNGFFVAYLERRRFSAKKRQGGNREHTARRSMGGAEGGSPLPWYNDEYDVATATGGNSPPQKRTSPGASESVPSAKARPKGKAARKGGDICSGGNREEGAGKGGMCKKKAKKIAWKRRQMELKVKRLQAKKTTQN